LPPVADLCRGAKRVVWLEDVENPTNVGAIFRSAAAIGMDAVVLTKACADPLYRRAVRVSMGTVFQVPWTFAENTEKGRGMHYVRFLQSLGFKTAALALRKDTVTIDDSRLRAEEKLAVILGAEGDGLTDETIDACDYTIKIPMAHGVDSLNVAACSAVAFWELAKRE
ncbi:MAG: RNA methyltransferase, partial [Lachnospiraceae bacterium]|nr:RNA methyltransferase [Lachnospiraceae bacterium]